MEEKEIDLIFESVAPYLSNHPNIHRFLNKNRHLGKEKLIKRVEIRVRKRQGTLRTDYKILLNKLVEK
jgi:hypothetical protein